VPTGFIDFDRMTHGLGRGTLVIVAGRPGMGKTSLALNIATHVAVTLKKTVGVFSLEMGQQELAMRILCSRANVRYSAVRQGHLSQQQWTKVIQTMSDIGKAPLYIDDSASPSILEVASKARRLKAEKNLELLVVDYLQLMQAGGRFENRNLEIAAITRSMKQLAKELDLPVILLSQLSRCARTSRLRPSAASSPTCASRARSSKTPTWWPSSTATRSTTRRRSRARPS